MAPVQRPKPPRRVQYPVEPCMIGMPGVPDDYAQSYGASTPQSGRRRRRAKDAKQHTNAADDSWSAAPTMKEVLLLGAGASVEAGVPTAIEMTRRLGDQLRSEGGNSKIVGAYSLVHGGLLYLRR